MKLLLLLPAFVLLSAFQLEAQSKKNNKNVSMLVYTKNGKGFIHDNIPSAVEALKGIAKEENWKITVSDDPANFTEENLKQFTLLVFPSTNNDVFDTDAQRLAFRRYMEAGGGFVGLHSVTGTERNWKWFKMMIGLYFLLACKVSEIHSADNRPQPSFNERRSTDLGKGR